MKIQKYNTQIKNIILNNTKYHIIINYYHKNSPITKYQALPIL